MASPHARPRPPPGPPHAASRTRGPQDPVAAPASRRSRGFWRRAESPWAGDVGAAPCQAQAAAVPWKPAGSPTVIPSWCGEGAGGGDGAGVRPSRIPVFHNHMTRSGLPWGLPASLPSHHQGRIRKPGTCGREDSRLPPPQWARPQPPPQALSPERSHCASAWDHQALLPGGLDRAGRLGGQRRLPRGWGRGRRAEGRTRASAGCAENQSGTLGGQARAT